MTSAIAPTPFQRKVLSIPEGYDLALPGGRGAGKTTAAGFLILQHVEVHGEHASVLYIRKTQAGAADFVNLLRRLFSVYGTATRFNETKGVWTLPSGARVEIGQLGEPSHYDRYQGKSYGLLVVDEATQFSDPALLDLLRSNLRSSSPNLSPRVVILANPGNVGHLWVRRRFVSPANPWRPYLEMDSGREFVTCPATLTDNEHLPPGYRHQIEASCANDSELRKAWVENCWDISRGAFFGEVLDERRVAFGPWAPQAFRECADPTTREDIPHAARIRMEPYRWRTFLSHDWGFSSPSVTLLCARSPGAPGPDGVFYPERSVLVLDEYASHVSGDLSKGLGLTVGELAVEIRRLAGRWGVSPNGVADDAIFNATGASSGSIASQFARDGVRFVPAQKGSRVSGWELLRGMLRAAGTPEPGCYIARNCSYLWSTLPSVGRDRRRIEDMEKSGFDHGADALRYGVLRRVGGGLRMMPIHDFLAGRR